jgi:hypothetical protein
MSVIPKAPVPETIPPADQYRLHKWIQYFKNLSPRTRVYSHLNKKEFEKQLADLHEKTLKYIFKEYESKELRDWPKEEEVVLIVIWDSSLPGQDSEFLLKNSRIFCFNNFAFGPDFFNLEYEYDEDSPSYDLIGQSDHCSLAETSSDGLNWEWITKIIKDRIEEIEKRSSVPKPPT